MKTKIVIDRSAYWIWLLPICILLIAGCDATLTLGGRTIGVSSGNFVFTDGYLTTSYNYPFDKVWKACEQTLADMKATAIEKDLKIATSTMTAIVQDEKLQILCEYISKDQTSVSIRIGLSGNNMASQLIHEKIAHNLLKPAIVEKP